jgi:hypothetical protein
LVKQVDKKDAADLNTYIGGLTVDRHIFGPLILSTLYRALAVAELAAPLSVQGAFIPARNSFDAAVAVGKVLKQAKDDVLIIDPYMDEKVLTDFAVLANETAAIRLLTDQKYHKPNLPPMVTRWRSQHTSVRSLEARLAPGGALHDANHCRQ